jgi:hypothetical protein
VEYCGNPNKILHGIPEEIPIPLLHCTRLGPGHEHGLEHGHTVGMGISMDMDMDMDIYMLAYTCTCTANIN